MKVLPRLMGRKWYIRSLHKLVERKYHRWGMGL